MLREITQTLSEMLFVFCSEALRTNKEQIRSAPKPSRKRPLLWPAGINVDRRRTAVRFGRLDIWYDGSVVVASAFRSAPLLLRAGNWWLVVIQNRDDPRK